MEKTELFKYLIDILNVEILKNNTVKYLVEVKEEKDPIHFYSVNDNSNYFDVLISEPNTFNVRIPHSNYYEDFLTLKDVQDSFRQWLVQFK
jgi:hypothetical protein